MKKTKFFVMALILMISAASVLASIQAGMIIFYVKDESGKKIEGVKIIVTDDKKDSFQKEIVTDDKGQARITLTFSHYKAEFIKDGYVNYVHPFKPKIGTRDKAMITLQSVEAAMEERKEELDPKDKAVFKYNEAVEVLKLNDFDTALTMLEEVVTMDPELAVAQFNLGRIYLMKGNLDKAEATLLKALELKPDLNPAYSMMADIYKKKGDTANQDKYMKMAEERGAVSAVDYYNQAVEAINSGNSDEAKEILLKCLETDDKYADAYYQLGIIAVSSGDNDKCIEYLKKYLELAPTGPNADASKAIVESLGGTL